MRYYGDVCLVLKPQAVNDDTLVLYCNSYDLSCGPIRECIIGLSDTANEAQKLAGRWQANLQQMAVCKVLHGASRTERRLTTGAVSDRVLSDEDYSEGVRDESFGADEIEEARVADADAGAGGRIADRLTRGPTPASAEMQWRQRRRRADRSLTAKGLRTRILVTTGRARADARAGLAFSSHREAEAAMAVKCLGCRKARLQRVWTKRRRTERRRTSPDSSSDTQRTSTKSATKFGLRRPRW